jgi:hypothetical protein
VAAWSDPDFDRYRHRRSSDPTATCATVRRREAYHPIPIHRALPLPHSVIRRVHSPWFRRYCQPCPKAVDKGAMDRCMNSTSPTPTGCPPESRPSVCVRADIGLRAMRRYRLPSVVEVATYLFRSIFTLNFNLTCRASAPALPLCI